MFINIGVGVLQVFNDGIVYRRSLDGESLILNISYSTPPRVFTKMNLIEHITDFLYYLVRANPFRTNRLFLVIWVEDIDVVTHLELIFDFCYSTLRIIKPPFM